jgi:uncharacterized membrane protein YphA (DoxX/SURF4 family)
MANAVINFANRMQDVLDSTRCADGLAPLLLRLYLAPVFLQAGWNKLSHFEDTAAWFGNPEWGLGLPMPEVMAALAAGTEFVGGLLLIVGLAVRWISIPLMVTMLVAAFAVHWENGWLAISDGSSWLANDRVMEAQERLEAAKSLLREHGHYDWLTGRGSIVILNNGIEFAITYFVMLFSLFFTGAGRFFSLDHWVKKCFRDQ